MPTPTKGPRLGGGPAHERLILANLATALFENDAITTTEAKAKRLRPLAERLITFAKRGDLHARRRVMTVVRDKSVVHRLFTEIAPDVAERPGGYTRITKIGPRKGDNAPMVVIELVREPMAKKTTVKEAEAATKRAAKDRAKKAAPAKAAPVDEPVSDVEELTLADAATEAEATDAAGFAPAESAPVGDDPAEATGAAEFATADDAPVGEEASQTAEAVELPAGAAAPLADGAAPEGYTIKGNADSGLYHEPGGRWYDATVAEFWFKTEADAEAAGFTKAGSKSS